MATNRSTSSAGGCLCRVPLRETVVPALMQRDLDAWAEANDVEILPNHRGEPSIDLPTAYRLYAADQAQSQEYARQEAERLARERITVQEAQIKRQATYEKAWISATMEGRSNHQASEAGWEAVHESEKRLKGWVRDRLGGVGVPSMLQPVRNNLAETW